MLKYKKLIKALYCLNQICPQNKIIIKVTDPLPNLRLKEECGCWILYIDWQNYVVYNEDYLLKKYSSKRTKFLNKK